LVVGWWWWIHNFDTSRKWAKLPKLKNGRYFGPPVVGWLVGGPTGIDNQPMPYVCPELPPESSIPQRNLKNEMFLGHT